jgi:hypothetical protein
MADVTRPPAGRLRDDKTATGQGRPAPSSCGLLQSVSDQTKERPSAGSVVRSRFERKRAKLLTV